MQTLSLTGANGVSEIYIENDLLSHAGKAIGDVFSPSRVHIVTDSTVAPLYLAQLTQQFDLPVSSTVIPAGEEHKRLSTVEGIYHDLLAAGMTRKDLIIALGGGVVGDITGFAAATFLRGVSLCQIPTTLLAQVDSSVGGKTGVDLPEGKNLVGAFYQPRLVLIDPDVLDTLPRRQYVNGLAEALKAGLIADPELFALFEKGDWEQDIEQIIYRSLKVKKNIVEQDEHEHGPRAAMNFGHTIGHGIEAVKGVRGRRKNGLYHGECVALGMLPMIEDKALAKRTRAVMRALGLPTRASYDKHKVLAQMRHDKKGRGGSITVIRVPGLGCWRADKLPMAELPGLLGMEEE